MMGDATSEVQLDFDRQRRIGLEEAVFAEGKTTAQLEAILDIAHERGARLLLTRLAPEKLAGLSPQWLPQLDYCAASRSAFFGSIPTLRDPSAEVAIVVAGSSDAGVAREAERTLSYNGVASQSFVDVGVAGLWRLTRRIDEIRRFPVVIAVAGMDAALPTVLGGLIPGVIVAVPTSVGYGVAAGGHTALHAILASCAPGISVVNIDNGYGAACAALRVLMVSAAAAPRSRAEDRALNNSKPLAPSLTLNIA
jgi:NCAIR mutase (PurE)-related protein